MIDLTPLDVRKKHEDFKRAMRGFDPQEVQGFLELVSERLEELVRENIQLKERSESLQQQVSSQSGREQAVQDALVTAQELRSDIQNQAQRESELIVGEAQTEARRLLNEAEAEVRTMIRAAERKLELGKDALEEMERRRGRFLKAFRGLLERELDVVEVEEDRAPLEDRPIDLDLGGGRAEPAPEAQTAPSPESDDDAGQGEVGGAEVGIHEEEDGAYEYGAEDDGFFDEAPAQGESAEPVVDLSAVDESAAEQPPMDLPVDQLAAAYGSEGGEAPTDSETNEETLFLGLNEAESEDHSDPDADADPDKGWA